MKGQEVGRLDAQDGVILVQRELLFTATPPIEAKS
jgi:hypothetical protein